MRRRDGGPLGAWTSGSAAPLGAVVALAAVGAVAWPSAPVGHWRSAEAHVHFLRAYRRAMADLPDPARTLDVRTGYGVVRVYRFAGTGTATTTPLVLLPGRASASAVWADNLPSLLALGDLYLLDLLGEPGLSLQARPVEDARDQATWLDEVLAALPEPRFHVVGLSIGGWTATNLALHRPERVAGLVLVEPVFVLAGLRLEAVLRSVPASVPWLPRSWRDGFNSWTAGGAPVEDVPVADLVEAGMRGYALALPQPARIPPGRLGELAMPVLVLLAGDSGMHDAGEAAALARRALPDATVVLVPGASHAISGEHPELVAAEVGRFVRRVR